MAIEKWSDQTVKTSMKETDVLMGLVNGDNAQIVVNALREIINKADQIITGNVTAVNFIGDGSGLTGFGATGGIINPGSTTIGADSIADGIGVIALQTRGITRVTIENDGQIIVEHNNLELGSSTIPTDITADGGGITLKGSTDKTIAWLNATDRWHFNQGIEIDSGNLIVEIGNVGIGTASPNSLLAVEGFGTIADFNGLPAATGASIAFSTDGTVIGNIGSGKHTSGLSGATQYDLGIRYTNNLYFTHGNTATELVVMDSSGNVGIGTDSPDVKLNVLGSVAYKALNVVSILQSSTTETVQILETSAGKAVGLANSDGAFSIYTNSDNGSFIAGDRAFTILTDGGNVGIGTASPTELLDINSDAIRLRSSQTIASAGATGDQGMICWDANYLYVCTATNTWVRTALAW